MVIGVLLNHLGLFGGVKRFLEIGNLLVARGHRFMIFTQEGTPPTWFPYRGEVLTQDQLPLVSLDVVIFTEPYFLERVLKAKARLKVFYAILQRPKIRRMLRQPELTFWANSEGMYRYLRGGSNPQVVKMAGGIDLSRFPFEARNTWHKPFTVLVYGRFYRKKKGVWHVIRACEILHRRGIPIKLLLFDSPVDAGDRAKIQKFTCGVPFEFIVDHPVMAMASIYRQADVFVSAERNAGWANTVIEAMASGVPVVATRSGTEDFVLHKQTGLITWRHSWFIARALRQVIRDPEAAFTRARAGVQVIQEFDWVRLTDRIENFIMAKLGSTHP